jgi:hypothetical protein
MVRDRATTASKRYSTLARLLPSFDVTATSPNPGTPCKPVVSLSSSRVRTLGVTGFASPGDAWVRGDLTALVSRDTGGRKMTPASGGAIEGAGGVSKVSDALVDIFGFDECSDDTDDTPVELEKPFAPVISLSETVR